MPLPLGIAEAVTVEVQSQGQRVLLFQLIDGQLEDNSPPGA